MKGKFTSRLELFYLLLFGKKDSGESPEMEHMGTMQQSRSVGPNQALHVPNTIYDGLLEVLLQALAS